MEFFFGFDNHILWPLFYYVLCTAKFLYTTGPTAVQVAIASAVAVYGDRFPVGPNLGDESLIKFFFLIRSISKKQNHNCFA